MDNRAFERPSAGGVRRGYMDNPPQPLQWPSSATEAHGPCSRGIGQLAHPSGLGVAIYRQLCPSSAAPFSPVGCPHHDPRELAAEQRDLVLGAGRPLAELAQAEL